MRDQFDLTPDGLKDRFIEALVGKKRALLVIGINYVGHEKGELNGCHNDVENWKEYIKQYHGFASKNVKVLMDDGVQEEPTFSDYDSFRNKPPLCS